ncbi:hypothetical protein [Bacteroides timonensis]|uniref:hypothetical protein n=1 Tax=Bacteroides timonensis TaxID=1470345 RepID=UPI0004BA857C|nr:hypothetical protein [Bacteroides timonensis]
MKNEDFALSRKELIKIAVLTIVLPLPVNWALLKLNPLTLMEGADDVGTWIGYGGSYIGGIIGGVISILILNRTLQQTGVLHRDLKVLQLNTIRYTQQEEWFTEFKQNLADNLKAIDLYVLNMVVSCLNMGDFVYAKSLLTDINKQLEQQNVTSTFLFPTSVLQKKEQEYVNQMRTVYLEYSALIKDLLFYIPLAETMEKGNELSYDALIEYAMTQYDYLKEQDDSQHNVEGNLCSNVLELNPDEPIGPALKRLVEMRLTMRTNLYRLKSELAQSTQQLIKYEEKRINSILSEEV